MRKYILPLVFGVAGLAVLLSLGVWQVSRLAWKEEVLARIEARIVEDPVPLVNATQDYQSVTVSGRFTGEEAHVLSSAKRIGAIYRIIGAFETTGGRTILIDRGYVRTEFKDATRSPVEATIIGNLHTPDEVDNFTPDPDVTQNIWYARDVPALAEYLSAEPIFIIARQSSENDAYLTPLPVDTSSIPNDHLGYAVTWFGLAVVWLVMTLFYIWRIRRNS